MRTIQEIEETTTDLEETREEAYIEYIEKYYGYMVFDKILRLRWEHVSYLQGGTVSC